jgi:hypothetical protein
VAYKHLRSAPPLCLRKLNPYPFLLYRFASPLLSYPSESSNGPVRGRSARLDPSLQRARPDPTRSHLDVARIILRPVPSLDVFDPSHDPSHSASFESARPDPSLLRSASATPYVPSTLPLGAGCRQAPEASCCIPGGRHAAWVRLPQSAARSAYELARARPARAVLQVSASADRLESYSQL